MLNKEDFKDQVNLHLFGMISLIVMLWISIVLMTVALARYSHEFGQCIDQLDKKSVTYPK